MPYLIQGFSTEKFSSYQLILNIHFILITNAIITPLLRIFDPILMLKFVQRQLIIRQKNQCSLPQQKVHQIFENPKMDIADAYSHISRTLLLSAWFAMAAPYGVFLSLLTLMGTYMIEKFCLLRV